MVNATNHLSHAVSSLSSTNILEHHSVLDLDLYKKSLRTRTFLKKYTYCINTFWYYIILLALALTSVISLCVPHTANYARYASENLIHFQVI